MESSEDSNQEALADKVMDSVGVEESAPESEGHEDSDNAPQSRETLAVQKRLKSQKRAHERELRELHAKIGDLESRMSSHQPSHEASMPMAPSSGNESVDEYVQRAVSHVLQQKDAETRRAQEAQNAQHIQGRYNEFDKHLQNMADKYDDFDDVVRDRDTPYTPSMRDYAITLPRSGPGSAGEVLYKLGKNPEELRRISKLHPLDQASEMAKLSHALISGGEHKSTQSTRPLGQIKSNPVTNSHAVTDKTPVSSIRQRMKQGSWK